MSALTGPCTRLGTQLRLCPNGRYYQRLTLFVYSGPFKRKITRLIHEDKITVKGFSRTLFTSPTSASACADAAVPVDPDVGPLAAYVRSVEEGVLKADPLQVRVAEGLDSLYESLVGYAPPPLGFFDDLERRIAERSSAIAKKKSDFIKANGESAAMPDFEALEPAIEPFEPPKGLYLHGPVGCGKTLLLDLFYDSVRTDRKMRVHFHAFVLRVHSELNRWRVQSGEEDVRPVEAIARQMIKDNWLICFDEIQHTDYGSSVLLHQIFEFMLSRGAVIVSTSNRAPSELGAVGFTDEHKANSNEALSGFAQLLVDRNEVVKIPSDTDYRTTQVRGKPSYFYPADHASRCQMEEAFTGILKAAGSPGPCPSYVTVYGRRVPLPVACEVAKVVRCDFNYLFNNPPLGPADYLAICNKYNTVFIDGVPAMSINEKNEARRFLSFIDSAYETKSNVFFMAETRPEDLFQLIPDELGAVDSEDKMQMEMLGEIAFDLKADLQQRSTPMDLRSLGILTGQDEIFSFKRAISRINEMQGFHYQRQPHRPIDFAPFLASPGEVALAEAKRQQREKKRREELDAVYPGPTKVPMMNLSSEWGSEASYEVWSIENMDTYNRRKAVDAEKRRETAPKFPEQHFYGAGWWENVVNKVKGRKSKDPDQKK